ncbi:MAG: precorrin-6y C5,15-methyltransferase (decarboxylating) subunit CbiE [Bacteroidaceae bacterium]|nr:precorrin-6y C5,15-methyltransferase (decarboxylating) subunit CbiE [Bacteroidaceae bacterium]MBP3833743.1 precorrin-6y C5,15-methyltransferase (decarboxylating) subunit CbiE [Bacteroidaceae bacterium]
MKKTFIVIGLSDAQEPWLDPKALDAISKAKVFSGGKRHHEIMKGLLPNDYKWIDITVPLAKVFEQYRETFNSQFIVVFASGDPLFFGFANTILREMPDAEIQLFPSFNSLQTLAHRILMPYQDMRIVSLTGRPWHEFDKALIERAPKMGVLTDNKEHTPNSIAQRMLEYGYDQYIMWVGEHLGNPSEERITKLSLSEAAQQSFGNPNCLILQAENTRPKVFGIPDEQFAILEGRPKMITKAPIRLLSLQALDLYQKHTLWDIGFCTGSVSIEAKLQFPHLQIVSFEVREEGKELMQINSQRFGTPGITTIIGDFLTQDLKSLPRPDAVFIGGHNGQLPFMLERIKQVLLPGGCVVFNSVSQESQQTFKQEASKQGFTLQPSLHIALNDYNPIEIIKATL